MKNKLILLLVLALPGMTGCNIKISDNESADDSRVIIGAEQLLTAEFLPLIHGKRVGLVTNHTGLLPDGRHLVDVLHKHPDVQLKVLFGPEHGIRGDADTHVADGTDPSTGLAVISLYGKVRKPTKEMLQNIDVLVFDIQDIGARFYTYIATMNHVLEAAAEDNLPYLILDRPNAIGGRYVDGPVYPLPACWRDRTYPKHGALYILLSTSRLHGSMAKNFQNYSIVMGWKVLLLNPIPLYRIASWMVSGSIHPNSSDKNARAHAWWLRIEMSSPQ